MVRFRRFEPTDLQKFSKCNLDPLTETYDLSFYLQYYAKWPHMFLVAEDDSNNVIGYIMGKLESSPEWLQTSPHALPWHGHITALTVAPEARRSGIGTILTTHLERVADNAAALFVDLFVRASNKRAIGFYEKLGYKVFRVVRNYYGDSVSDPTAGGEDAYDMRKAMGADFELKHARDDGLEHEVYPEDVF